MLLTSTPHTNGLNNIDSNAQQVRYMYVRSGTENNVEKS